MKQPFMIQCGLREVVFDYVAFCEHGQFSCLVLTTFNCKIAILQGGRGFRNNDIKRDRLDSS